MKRERKSSFVETRQTGNEIYDDPSTVIERQRRRASFAAFPLMNRLRPFIHGPKNDDVPDCYNRVRYIRDACKTLADLWKTDKDYLNKSIDSDVSKAFKEFRLTEIARNYRTPCPPNGDPSILNQTIEDLILIHDYIDSKRRDSLEQIKRIIEQAKDKQSNMRQTMTDLRDSYEKAQRKLEAADTNLKKFQVRADRLTLPNFDERLCELEEIRNECEQSRTLARDTYATETYRFASEEHSVTVQLFNQYLFEQTHFYNDISKYLSSKMPDIEQRADEHDFRPSFRCDLVKHCSKRSDSTIAYPIEICVRLLKHSVREEGLFRIAPSHQKQKKLVAELDLQLIEKGATLSDLGYDAHVAASTLKQYLRELPDCLLTSALLPSWNEIPLLSNEQARVQRISQLLTQLPKINYDNLSYLIRFLTRIAENSSENKMTAPNLGICIGCSVLYPKDQTTNASVSNTLTSASMIVELMITYYKQLFTNSNQQEQIMKTIKSQPDLIPTEFHTKSRSVSNENLLEVQNLSTAAHPSPGTRRKNKAPPPPPITISDQTSIEHNTTGGISTSFSPSDKIHRRTPSDGTQLDRPGAPPPLPPPVVVVPSPVLPSRQRHSISTTSNHEIEQDPSSPNDEKPNNNELSTNPMTTADGVNVGKLISELNNRMAAAKLNTAQTNNIRASSIRNSTINTPGETTDF